MVFAFPLALRHNGGMPERPGKPNPPVRDRTEQESADAAKYREIVRRAPPLPDKMPPFPETPPLDSGLADLCGIWLLVRCDCGQSADLPLRLMAVRHGWRTKLGDMLPRLRCKGCGARPGCIEITNSPTIDAPGPKPEWARRLRLV